MVLSTIRVRHVGTDYRLSAPQQEAAVGKRESTRRETTRKKDKLANENIAPV